MKILAFGNPLVEEDSLVLKILPKLRKEFPEIEFEEVDPTEGLDKHGKDLILLDVVQGIDKVMMIDSVEQLQTNKIYSMHDFDLAYNLKILKKLDLIDSVKIIGVPMGMDEGEALKEVGKSFLILKITSHENNKRDKVNNS
jgi:Ni,Fe-hydrogenase maturation factor